MSDSKSMKYVVFLGDGMADEPLDELGGKTPLQAAHKPNMDRIAREGACGLLKTVPDGLNPDSTVANLGVMGYDATKCLEGRGVLEAAAMGVDIGPEDHAMRLNIINVQNGNIISHSADNISTEEASELIAALAEHLKYDGVEFHAGISYRHVLKITRPASKAIDCDPPHDYLDQPMAEHLPRATAPEGEETAALLREIIEKSNAILENHPVNTARAEKGLQKANYCWPWSIGRRPQMATFKEMFGVSGAVICAVDLIRGIGTYAGLRTPRVEGATGLWNTNYEGKAAAALDCLKELDLVYIHVEAPDEAGHEGNIELKVKTIEDLDRRILGPVMEALGDDNVRYSVLPDHPTPLRIRTHTSDPVPFAIMGSGIAADSVQCYDENACAAGSLQGLRGADFMRKLIGVRL